MQRMTQSPGRHCARSTQLKFEAAIDPDGVDWGRLASGQVGEIDARAELHGVELTESIERGDGKT